MGPEPPVISWEVSSVDISDQYYFKGHLKSEISQALFSPWTQPQCFSTHFGQERQKNQSWMCPRHLEQWVFHTYLLKEGRSWGLENLSWHFDVGK